MSDKEILLYIFNFIKDKPKVHQQDISLCIDILAGKTGDTGSAKAGDIILHLMAEDILELAILYDDNCSMNEYIVHQERVNTKLDA